MSCRDLLIAGAIGLALSACPVFAKSPPNASYPLFKYELFVVAGPSQSGEFPPGLNTSDAATDLSADETPDGYGFDLTKDGFIAKGTIPSGTTRIILATNISSVAYEWHYNRLWRANGTALEYYAPFYQDVIVPQGLSKFVFDEDANSVLGIVPFGGDRMAVVKSTGSYILERCSDTRGFMQRSELMQELYAPATNNVTELDGALYVSNGKGLVAYDGGKTVEITRKIRNDLTGYTNLTLTADYVKHWLIGGSTLVYSPETKKLYKYSGSAFRFTTRQFHAPGFVPFTADRVLFIISHGDTGNGSLTYSVRYEDDPWSKEYTVLLPYSPEKYTVVSETLEQSRTVRRIQFRITNIVGAKYLRTISMDAESFSTDDMAL